MVRYGDMPDAWGKAPVFSIRLELFRRRVSNKNNPHAIRVCPTRVYEDQASKRP